jgi:hypothetical protein
MINQKSRQSIDSKTKSVEEVVFVRRAFAVEEIFAKKSMILRPSSHKQTGLLRPRETVLASPLGRPRSSVHPMQVMADSNLSHSIIKTKLHCFTCKSCYR